MSERDLCPVTHSLKRQVDLASWLVFGLLPREPKVRRAIDHEVGPPVIVPIRVRPTAPKVDSRTMREPAVQKDRIGPSREETIGRGSQQTRHREWGAPR